MQDYWVLPPATFTRLHTVFKQAPPHCRKADEVAPHAFWSGTLLGKDVALQGGAMEPLDASVDPARDPKGWDIFEIGGDGSILYWGTFRGNHPGPPPAGSPFGSNTMRSNAFEHPVVFMQKSMSVGSAVANGTRAHEMSNWLRKETATDNWCYQVRIDDHLTGVTSPADPTSTWSDVLVMTYRFGSCNGPIPTTQDQWQAWERLPTTMAEKYWLQDCKAPGWAGKACGTIYFESLNPEEPSCVAYQFAADQTLHSYEQGDPSVPWYDPFMWQTHVRNGFFEDGPQADELDFHPPAQPAVLCDGPECWSAWRGWSGQEGVGTSDSEDVIATNSNPNPFEASDSWNAMMRAAPTGGWDLAVSEPIQVQENTTYRLSGWLHKGSADDDVYLDFDDMEGYDNIAATAVGWQFVSGCRRTPPGTRQVSVRCVRDAGNAANAQCDGITLQHVRPDCLGGVGGGGPSDNSGGGAGCVGGKPNGVCEPAEKWVTYAVGEPPERWTSCPEDCPSCGMVGGDHCSQNATCPSGFTPVDSTYDCPSCCDPLDLPTCGTMGGDHCSQTGACPQGYTPLGQSSDCSPCCELAPLPSCGSMGGNHCSQSSSCPQGHDSLGQSSDCAACCKSCISTGCPAGSCGWQTDNCGTALWCGSCLQSCGQMGGDYCSQWGGCPPGYDSLGVSSDCHPCCRQGPSCGAVGGNYCSQDGSCPDDAEDLGRTHDCNHCCRY
jgi:hypothetical protein